MHEENREQGIILKVKNYSVSDKIITFISSSGKKSTFILKSIKSPKSRKAHAVDISNYVEIKTKSGYSMPLITDIKLLDEFETLKKDHNGIFYIQGLCEIADNLAYEEVENESLYLDLLFLLQKCKSEEYKFLIAIFLIKHIQEAGYMPEVPDFQEGVCASRETVGFYLREEAGTFQINDEEYKVFKSILEREIDFTCRIKPSEKTINLLYELAISWYQIITEKRFNSGIFIK